MEPTKTNTLDPTFVQTKQTTGGSKRILTHPLKLLKFSSSSLDQHPSATYASYGKKAHLKPLDEKMS